MNEPSKNAARVLREICEDNGIPYDAEWMDRMVKFCDEPVESRPVMVECLDCAGTGASPVRNGKLCTVCKGTGKVTKTSQEFFMELATEMRTRRFYPTPAYLLKP